MQMKDDKDSSILQFQLFKFAMIYRLFYFIYVWLFNVCFF